MSIRIVLIIVGIILLVIGIAFIIRNIGSDGKNRVKAFGVEFESSNGVGALILFFGFVFIITGARMDGNSSSSGKTNEPPGVTQNRPTLLTAYQLGDNVGELMWYEYKYKNNRYSENVMPLC